MAILRYIIPLLSAVLLTGCYEDFIPEIDTKPALCLNSLITAGEPIKVDVTHTWMFNDDKSAMNHQVTDAEITIFANGNKVGPDYLPRDGDRIRIVADSPAYGTATAEVTVPFAVPIGKVKVTPTVTGIWKNDEEASDYGMDADVTFNLNIELDLNDPAEVDNYYQFDYVWYSPAAEDYPYYDGDASSWSNFSIGSFKYDSEPLFKEHVGVFETIMGNYEDTGFVFFTDRQFRGKTYTLHLDFANNSFNVKSSEYDESLLECGMNLYLKTISRSYYDWAVYKWNVDEGVLGDLSDIGLAESKWGYSNVSTGAGVVAAQSFATYTIDFTPFLIATLAP